MPVQIVVGWRAGEGESGDKEQNMTSCDRLQWSAVHELWTMRKKDGYSLRQKYHFS